MFNRNGLKNRIKFFDEVLAHLVCPIQLFFIKQNMPLVSHPPYSLNLAFNDLFLFIKLTCTQKEMASKSSKRHP